MIAVREKTWEDLTKMWTLEDTFDSVISRMIDREVATSGQAANHNQTAATAPERSEDRTDK